MHFKQTTILIGLSVLVLVSVILVRDQVKEWAFSDTSVVEAAPPIEVYPSPGIDTYKSTLYSVEVFGGSSWIPAYVYGLSQVSSTHWHQGATPSVNFLTLGTGGAVNVRITKLSGPITSVQASPKSKSIPVQISGGKATLTLNPNSKAWVTIDGDDANPLFIFADNVKPSVPAGATYFGPGVQDISPSTGNHYQASNNEVIYLDGGAWVRGNIITAGTSNVQIMGPGVLSGDLWDPATVQQLPWNEFQNYFMIYGGQYGIVNTGTVKGITIVDSPGYNIYSMSSAYSTKILSPWFYQTDGFSVIDVDQSFAFNGDTTFHLEEAFWSDATGGYTVDLSVTNSFVGNTNNAVFLGGFWGNPANATFSTLVDNVDVKTYNNNDWVLYGAPPTPSLFQIWVDNNDSTKGHSNQTYQNIRIEGDVKAPLAMLKNLVYPWGGANAYNPPLGNSHNLTFKDITLEGIQLQKSEVKGWDANNRFHNVTFQNLKINGSYVTQANYSTYFDTNAFVTSLTFPSPSLPTASLNASPTSIMSGGTSTLSWTTTGATSVSISPTVGVVGTSGTRVVSPTTNTTYILTATNAQGSATSQKAITVVAAAPTPTTTAIFYPNTDGRVAVFTVGGTGCTQAKWSAVRGQTSTNDVALTDAIRSNFVGTGCQGNNSIMLTKGFFSFDTSSIPDNANIISAKLKLYPSAKTNQKNDGNDFISVVEGKQASATTLVGTDFPKAGNTIDNPIEGSNRVDITSIPLNTYTTWTLNSNGLGWISKTGHSKFAVREGHDILNIWPSFAVNQINSVSVNLSEQTGTAKDPILEVTYK